MEFTDQTKKSRLQFNEDKTFHHSEKSPKLQNASTRLADKQTKKLNKLKHKAQTAENKYFKAESKLPTKKKRLFQIDKNSITGASRLKFTKEEMIKAPKESLKTVRQVKNTVKSGIKDTAFTAVDGGNREQSVDEVQGKQVVATAFGTAKNVVSAPMKLHRFRVERKFKRFEKAEKRTIKANTKLETSKLKFELQAKNKVTNGSARVKGSNPISNLLQKKQIRKQYQKKLKEKSMKIAKGLGTKLIGSIKGFINPMKKIGLIAIVAFMLMNFIVSCSNVFTQGFIAGLTGTTYASYTADEAEIEQADWLFSELETALDETIEKTEINHLGYDEYRYFLNGSTSTKQGLIDAIKHDAFSLIAYLTVMFDDFKFADIKGHIQSIFDEMFVLSTSETIEIRTRTAYDDEGNPYDENYEYRIFNTELTVNELEAVAAPYMEGKKETGIEHYDLLIESEGNHQSYGSPFNFAWHGNISCHYGGRDNPTGANTGSTTASGKEMHTGLDIAVGQGTPIYSVMDGTVTFSGWHDLYGSYIDVTDKNGNKSRYAHCSALLVGVGTQVKKGQVIAKVGSTGNSTGNHLHIEIFQNGKRINPLFVLSKEPKATEESEG